MSKTFDLAIIGGGPAGYVAAERAGKKGLKVVLIEKKILELNKLINDFKFDSQIIDKKQKRKIYNKNYYQKLKSSKV